MSAIASAPTEVPGEGPVPLTLVAAAPQRVLAVEVGSADGRSRKAIGGGETIAAAIAWARESCPDATTWHTVSWNDLYGD
jgi:xanthine/CO dehydrogenase XdhC/CoxF family maturation factor